MGRRAQGSMLAACIACVIALAGARVVHQCSHGVVRSLYRPQRARAGTPLEVRRGSSEGLRVRFAYGDWDPPECVSSAFEWFGGVLSSAVVPSERFGAFGAVNCYSMESLRTDADMTVFVMAQDAHCGSGTIAWGAVCQEEYTTGRPVSGVVNLCPGALPADAAELRLVVAHETMHALGFSEYYLRPERFYEGGATVKKITAPSPLSVARGHFGCAALNGVVLSPDGSHVSERLYFDDGMSPCLTESSAMTPLDFAALDALQFYSVNWTAAARFDGVRPAVWGRGLGCQFAELGCLQHYLADRRRTPYCFQSGRGCTFDRSAVGVCGLYEYSAPLPPSVARFTNPRVGGRACMDYCPYYERARACQSGTGCVDMGRGPECLPCEQLDGAIALGGEVVLNCSARELCTRAMPLDLRGELCDRGRVCDSGAVATLCALGLSPRAAVVSKAARAAATLAAACAAILALCA